MDLVRGIDSGGGSIGFVPNGGGGDERDIFHVRFDPADESVVEVVVNAVSVIHNVDPIELEPLSDAVDPDVLENLFRQRESDASAISSEVTFGYEGLEITVNSDGHVWLARNEPGD